MPRPILIVSGDETSRRLLSRALRHADFNTVQAHDLGIALTMMRFDCIGTTVFDASIPLADRQLLVMTLEQRMSHIHLVYVNSHPMSGNSAEVVRACRHCSMQGGLGRVYTVGDSILAVTPRADSLAKFAGSDMNATQRRK